MAWNIGDDIVIGGMAVLAISGLFAPLLFRPVSWGRRSGEDVMVYPTPALPRLYLGAGGVWLIAATVIIGWGGGVAGGFVMLIGIVFGGVLLWAALRRFELSLNTQRRTYRLTRGWLLGPRVTAGPLEDFAGVFMRSYRVRGGDLCAVGLAWRNGVGGRPYLGRYSDPEKADAAAVEAAVTLGLPRVAAPPPEGLRSLLR